MNPGANLDIRDSNGLTALEYAVYKSHLEIAEALNTAGDSKAQKQAVVKQSTNT